MMGVFIQYFTHCLILTESCMNLTNKWDGGCSLPIYLKKLITNTNENFSVTKQNTLIYKNIILKSASLEKKETHVTRVNGRTITSKRGLLIGLRGVHYSDFPYSQTKFSSIRDPTFGSAYGSTNVKVPFGNVNKGQIKQDLINEFTNFPIHSSNLIS